MPSPFPGMDPYLESSDWFSDLHDGLISSIKAGLQTSLPRGYYARTRQRVWLDLGHRSPVEPDVGMADVEPALSPQKAEWVKARLAAEQV
jgi:hypothetical protein